jgi:hypothetical protein
MKKKVEKPNKAKKAAKTIVPKDKSELEDRFDFGGLPQRDLKKNLGCG